VAVRHARGKIGRDRQGAHELGDSHARDTTPSRP
jgi:hypothetical protein